MNREFTFFSRSVTEGHADKLCDQISDAIVGLHLRQDPLARVSAECAAAGGILFVAVRFDSKGALDIPTTVRGVVSDIGYDTEDFNPRSCTVMTSLAEYRPAMGQPQSGDYEDVLATDQAAVFGYACKQTPEMLPLPIWLAHRLVRRLDGVRKSGELDYLAPEGSAQVGVRFIARRPVGVYSVNLIASQREPETPPLDKLREEIREAVIEPVFAHEELGLDDAARVDVNPMGPVSKSGPAAHAGLTGRKTAEDTYGEYARHSQIALSGKDPSRVGRAGSYVARYAAKNVVAAGLAEECELQLSYALGSPGPISIDVDTFGSGAVSEDEIEARLKRTFDFRIGAVIRQFDLRGLPARHTDGYYRKLAVYGHVGREDIEAPWEALDKVDALS